MKKILTVLAICFSGALLFAGGAKENTANAPAVIKFANYAILEKGYEAFWTNVKTDFEAKNPGITIEWVTAPYGEIQNQVINMAGAGNKADLLFGEIGWVPSMEDAGLAVPVDTVLSKSYLDDYFPKVMDSFKIDGKVYAVPMYISPFMLYYNKDLFAQAGLDPAKPPKTYTEMLAMSEKLSQLKDKSGNKVFAFGQTTASVPVSGSALTAMIFNFGGQVLDADGKLSVDNKGFREAFDMLKVLDEKGYNPQNAKLKDLRNLFAIGQLAMYYDQSWGFNGVQSINPDAKRFTASAKPLSGGKGKGASLLQSHCLILMDNGPAQKAAVAKLVEYLVTPEVLSDYLQKVTPASPAKQTMSASVADNEVLKGAAGSAENVVPMAFVPKLSNLNLELSTLAQAVTMGKKDIDSSIAAFKKSAAALLEQ